jgi:uncharacterized membrane protein YfcA
MPLLLYVVGVAHPHIAIGTGALAVSVNAFANFASHAIKRHVWWRCVTVFSALGVQMLKPRKPVSAECRPIDLKMCHAIAAGALAAGATSSFFRIGGGFLIVPGLMLATGMPMINAIGTSLLSVAVFGLATALSYASSGLMDWWLASEFIGGGIVGGVFGMLLAARLSAYKNILNRLFAALIFVVAAYILYGNWGTVVPGEGAKRRTRQESRDFRPEVILAHEERATVATPIR